MRWRSVLEVWLLSVDFGRFISVGWWEDRSQHFNRSTVNGPLMGLLRWVSRGWRAAAGFSGVTSIAFIVASVRFHVELSSAKFCSL